MSRVNRRAGELRPQYTVAPPQFGDAAAQRRVASQLVGKFEQRRADSVPFG